MADQATFEVEVLTPEGEVFRGDAVQLSTRTVVGEVGIWPTTYRSWPA
ncbi:MAG: hypothetical protein ACKOL0_06390 [Solirubrobacterales bacterium]